MLWIDPDEIRSVRRQEYARADGLRKAAIPPYAWLGEFLNNYGKIALPVKQALDNYYAERQDAYNALADQHVYMGDALGKFLHEMLHIDNDGAGNIANNTFNGGPPAPPAGPPPGGGRLGSGPGPGVVVPPAGPPGTTPRVGPNGSTPMDPAGGATPGGPVPVGPGAPDGTTSQPPAAAASGPNGAELAGAPTAPFAGSSAGGPSSGGPPPGGRPTVAVPPAGGPPPVGGPPGGGPGPSVVVPPPTGQPGQTPPTGETQGADTSAGQAPDEPIAPVPLVPGAAPAGQRRGAEPSHDVDPGENYDLLLARTLLAAVLAAVSAGGARQSTSRVDWSVSVMRGPAGPSVFVTTNEGRGWLPAGLFLPQEVSVPWLAEVADAAPAGEENADPARALVDFARTWGEPSGAWLTALVSSTGIDDEVRGLVGESVGVEASIGPARSDVDLAAPGVGLVDRLTATGGAAGDVPEGQVVAQCVRLAADAHAQVVRSVGAGLERDAPEVAVARRLREEICAAVQAGRHVPEQLWQDLWNADVAVEAQLAARRSRGDAYRGDVRLDHPNVVTQLLFERRCNELVLLLADGASQQTLRDVTYSHGQVVDHPALGRAPLVAAAEARADRLVVTPGGVVAPPVSPAAATPPPSSAEDRAGP